MNLKYTISYKIEAFNGVFSGTLNVISDTDEHAISLAREQILKDRIYRGDGKEDFKIIDINPQ